MRLLGTGHGQIRLLHLGLGIWMWTQEGSRPNQSLALGLVTVNYLAWKIR